MKVVILFLSLCVVSSFAVAQNSNENLVQYDPLFWKEKLKLDPSQCQKIKEINTEYYETLYKASKQEKNNRNELRSIANKSLLHRSQEIWETFHPKQRKRWKKMWQASTIRLQANES
jgi:trehalose/maltose hydrolase-like predicted phosphorylase